MTALVTDDMLAKALAAAGITDATPGPEAVASPSYLALESRSVFGMRDGQRVFLKVMHPEMRAGFDLAAAMALAISAGETKAGPRVLWSDDASIAMEAVEGGCARQSTLQDAGFMTIAMAALRRLHACPALPNRFDPFAQIDTLTRTPDLPEDAPWMLALLDSLRDALMAAPTVPCRNDGSSSNIMTNGMLVDYDRAGMNDPMYDVGALLAEMTDFEQDMQAPFAAYGGSAADFARARLWSIVDDVMHGLWAREHGKTSVRRAVEWLKYGEWRLMRARMQLRHPQFELKSRIVRGTA